MSIPSNYKQLADAINLGSAVKEASQYQETGAVKTSGDQGVYSGPSKHYIPKGPLEARGTSTTGSNLAPPSILPTNFSNATTISHQEAPSKRWKFATLTKDEWLDLLLKVYIAIIILSLAAISALAFTGRL